MNVNIVDNNEVGKEANSIVIPEKSEKPSIDAIPDLDELTKNVFEIVEYLERDDIIELCKNSEHIVLNTLNNKYVETVPYSMIKLLMDVDNRVENVERVLDMISMLIEAKKGNYDLEKAEKDFTDKINERYLYSKYGSRENFENALAKAVAQERRKETKVQSY